MAWVGVSGAETSGACGRFDEPRALERPSMPFKAALAVDMREARVPIITGDALRVGGEECRQLGGTRP